MPHVIERFLIFALIHSITAADFFKHRLELRWPGIPRWYRLVYNLVATISFGWLMAGLPGSPILYEVPPPAAAVMRAIQVLVALLFCRCVVQTGLDSLLGLAQLSQGKESSPKLVTDGCYRKVRHPQYALALAFLLLAPMVTLNYALFTLLATLYLCWGCFIEERRLTLMFGDAYRRYRNATPLFLPRLRV